MISNIENQPLVSILTGTYNNDEYLKANLDSVIKSTYKNFEFIIVNDGSTDQTKEILASYQKNNPQLIVINKENTGLTDSLNIGLEKCSGKYVMRIDTDDTISPDRISKQVKYLEQHSDVGILGTNATLIDKDNNVIGVTKHKFSTNSEIEQTLLQRKAFFCHSSWMVRKEIYANLNGYDRFYKKAQDYDFLLRSLPITKIACLDEPLVTLRLTDTSIGNDKNFTQYLFASVSLLIFCKEKKIISYPNINKMQIFQTIESYIKATNLIHHMDISKKVSTIKKLINTKRYYKALLKLIRLTLKHPCFIYSFLKARSVRIYFPQKLEYFIRSS